jgi:hypothetical protein
MPITGLLTQAARQLDMCIRKQAKIAFLWIEAMPCSAGNHGPGWLYTYPAVVLGGIILIATPVPWFHW